VEGFRAMTNGFVASRGARTRADRSTVQLSAVIPVFNEQDNLRELYQRLTAVFSDLGVEYELIFVNDGSKDATGSILDTLALRDRNVVPLHLSRNFGHQSALTAGLDHARGEAVVVLDGDLQDPPEVIPELVERWREGHDVVYAVRTKRKESWFKRLGYFLFYRVFRGVSNLDVPLDAGDFCLMDRKAVSAMNRLPEQGRFVRGLRAYVGFRQIGVPYERDARFAGRPKYTLGKLCGLACDGVVGFGSFPAILFAWMALGLTCAALLFGAWIGLDHLTGAVVADWKPVSAGLLGLAALQFGAMALMSLYLVKILAEVKARPTYIVDAEPHAAAKPLLAEPQPNPEPLLESLTPRA
jgi:dolichol-phosphate mannosyltransferase